MKILHLTPIVILACAIGCTMNVNLGTRQGTGNFIQRSEINPAMEPYKKAQLILGGTKIPVQLVKASQGEEVTFNLVTSTTIETEHFLDQPAVFSFEGLSDERYSPAIPVLKFPFQVGDQWSWKGDYIVSSTTKIPADAKIKISEEKLNKPGAPSEAYKVQVDMVLGEGAKTSMSFWFAKNSGLIMRQVGQNSSREPLDPD